MIPYPVLPADVLAARLQPPKTPVPLILDTDTYNEIDDQFALAYALCSPEAIDLLAIYAAPFFNERSSGPADGMERSYEEIHRVLDRMGEPPGKIPVLKGSTTYLTGPEVPVESPAARDLVDRALSRSPEDPPLYVAAIGAITNIASAILMEPKIIERMVVLWLGGHARFYPSNHEFNLKQDVPAAQIIFDSGVPLIWFPCQGMASQLVTTMPELRKDLAGRSAIGDYLVEITGKHHADHFAWGKVIWDVAPVSWLVNPDWLVSRIDSSPQLENDESWVRDDARHPICEALFIHRNAVFRDLFTKLGKQ